MKVEVPYGNGHTEVSIDDARVAGVVVGNDVPVVDEAETIAESLRNPINSPSLDRFFEDARDVLFIVNDATRPTPTARILESIFKSKVPQDFKFLVATGAHREPSDEEYFQIFGGFFSEFRSRIFAHNSRASEDMLYLGRSRSGTELLVNRLAIEAHKVVIISSVEPHYFAGYTGGRKSFFPGVASFKSIEENHRHAIDARARSLALEGNPVHEDMVDALRYLRFQDLFGTMTVLDKNHRVYAATSGQINDCFYAAVERAKEVFCVPIKEKADIVVTVAKFPMDIDLYQSQKALEHGKLALKPGGIIILVSKCRQGTGDDTFIRLLSSCDSPSEVQRHIEKGYVLGYHKAAKLAEINSWAEMYAVTDLPDHLIQSIHIKPFSSLEDALDSALHRKGKAAKVLFMLDGSLTVPMVEG